MGAAIHYTRPDGRPCQGYYASPASRDQNYDPDAAEPAWQRTAAFLGTHLA